MDARAHHLLSSKYFHLIILPTEECNFRCNYCYEHFEHGKMSEDVVRGIKNLVLRRVDELNQLVVSWFGGEPLAAKDVVLDISRSIADASKKRPHLSFKSGATTNGSLLDLNTLSTLVSAGVTDYQISVDGPKQIHDSQRVTMSGRGTFDRIWSNLIAARDSAEKFNILLRVHFTVDSVEKLESFVRSVDNEFLIDQRFGITFQAIQRLGGPRDTSIKIMSREDVKSAKERLESLISRTSVRFSEESDYICYAARPNSLLIRADGKIGKCTVALRDGRNCIGHLNPDGTIEIDHAKLSPWLRGIKEWDQEIMACPMKDMPKMQ